MLMLSASTDQAGAICMIVKVEPDCWKNIHDVKVDDVLLLVLIFLLAMSLMNPLLNLFSMKSC